jgi:hypothetical protein
MENITAPDNEIVLQDKRIVAVTKALRQKNLQNDLPFLVLSEDLPEGQAYREFADGRIEVQEVYEQGPDLKSKVVRTLTKAEVVKVRLKYGLF